MPVRAGINTLSKEDNNCIAITLQDLSLYYETEEAVLAERNRIARKLHDSVTQTLFSVSMIAGALPQLWQINVEEGEARLNEMQRLTRSAMLDMQTLLHELRPVMLIDIGLDELLHQLVEMAQSKSDISVHFDISGSADLPLSTRIGLYRIAQEALSNVSHHASATNVNLVLEHDAEYTILKIADDGCGFDVERTGQNQPGLAIMRQRAHEIGATIEIKSQLDTGTKILVQWPNNQHDDEV